MFLASRARPVPPRPLTGIALVSFFFFFYRASCTRIFEVGKFHELHMRHVTDGKCLFTHQQVATLG
jgi:hypothetical protein